MESIVNVFSDTHRLWEGKVPVVQQNRRSFGLFGWAGMTLDRRDCTALYRPFVLSKNPFPRSPNGDC